MKKCLLLLMLIVAPVVQANPVTGFVAKVTAKYSIKPREYVMAAIIGVLTIRNAGLQLQSNIAARTLLRCATEMRGDVDNAKQKLEQLEKSTWWWLKNR